MFKKRRVSTSVQFIGSSQEEEMPSTRPCLSETSTRPCLLETSAPEETPSTRLCLSETSAPEEKMEARPCPLPWSPSAEVDVQRVVSQSLAKNKQKRYIRYPKCQKQTHSICARASLPTNNRTVFSSGCAKRTARGMLP